MSNDSSAPVTPPITVDQQVATLMGFLTIADGVIEDKDQGVIGYILGADIFTSSGLGFGRFYYVLAPSVISFDSIATSVLGYLDSSKTAALGAAAADIQKSVTATVNDWFRAYMKKPGDVQVQVQKYLLQYGNAKIVDATSGQLTKFGQSRLQAIMSGKVSLKYPSMKLSTITNQYVYDFGKTAPDKMPDGITILDQSYGAARLSARTTDSGVVPKA